MIELINTSSLFDLTPESTVSKRNLFDLIQFSKKTESEYWTGENNVINNTPQQGINWIGSFPNLSGLILKVKEGSYLEDGWINDQQLEKLAKELSTNEYGNYLIKLIEK